MRGAKFLALVLLAFRPAGASAWELTVDPSLELERSRQNVVKDDECFTTEKTFWTGQDRFLVGRYLDMAKPCVPSADIRVDVKGILEAEMANLRHTPLGDMMRHVSRRGWLHEYVTFTATVETETKDCIAMFSRHIPSRYFYGFYCAVGLDKKTQAAVMDAIGSK